MSDGRRETKAMSDKINAENQRLMKVVASKTRPAPAQMGYPKVYGKTIPKVISDAPEVRSKDGGLPELLDLKVAKDMVTLAMTGTIKLTRRYGKEVGALPDAPAEVGGAMKLARVELDRLKDIDRDCRNVASRHHRVITAFKDLIFEKLLEAVAKSLPETVRQVHAATVPLKKRAN